jgi:hypothetical protein
MIPPHDGPDSVRATFTYLARLNQSDCFSTELTLLLEPFVLVLWFLDVPGRLDFLEKL